MKYVQCRPKTHLGYIYIYLYEYIYIYIIYIDIDVASMKKEGVILLDCFFLGGGETFHNDKPSELFPNAL